MSTGQTLYANWDQSEKDAFDDLAKQLQTCLLNAKNAARLADAVSARWNDAPAGGDTLAILVNALAAGQTIPNTHQLPGADDVIDPTNFASNLVAYALALRIYTQSHIDNMVGFLGAQNIS